MNVLPTSEDRDKRVLELYEKVLEVEQRLIPTGLHVFGRASNGQDILDLLRMVASFDRPELGIRPLTNLIAEGRGLPASPTLLNESAASEQRLAERERVEAVTRRAIEIFLDAGPEEGSTQGWRAAGAYLAEQAGIPSDQSRNLFSMLATLRERLAENHEIRSLLGALRG